MEADHAHDLATSGYVERAILDCLATDGYNTRICTTAAITRHAVRANRVGNAWGEIAADQHGEDDDVARSSVRRAAGRLEDRGLLQRYGDIDDFQDSFYTHQGDVPADPDEGLIDGRETAWALTRRGAHETQSMDRVFFNELYSLLRRFGRYSPDRRG